MVELLPALSTAVPVIVCAPTVVTVTGDGQVTIPDKPSEQLKLTTADPVFTPFASGGGDTLPPISGGVLSMLTVTVAVAE